MVIKMKTLTTLLLACLLAVTVQSQTAVIPNYTAAQGQLVGVPICVHDWGSVMAITLHVEYDKSRLQLTGVNCMLPDMLWYDNNGVIGFSWCDLTPVMIYHNKLIALEFEALAPGKAEINFVPINEVMHNLVDEVNVAYTNGTVTVLPLPVKAKDEAF